MTGGWDDAGNAELYSPALGRASPSTVPTSSTSTTQERCRKHILRLTPDLLNQKRRSSETPTLKDEGDWRVGTSWSYATVLHPCKTNTNSRYMCLFTFHTPSLHLASQTQ